MILYFDNYITDAGFKPIKTESKVSTSFHSGSYTFLHKLRESGAEIYKMPSKLDITLYTLASYAEIKNWSAVIIKYELENPSQKKKFEREVLKLFPNAILIYGRSDSQKKFQESINLIDSLNLNDPWVFYAGNNDHPYIAYDSTILAGCLEEAKKFLKKTNKISIAVSHYPEFLNKPRDGTPFHEVGAKETKIIEENEHCIASLFPNGLMHSMQIVHLDLFKHWFFSGNAEGKLIRRSECIEPYVKTSNQIVIIPKKELCAHFDGEIVTEYCLHNIPYELSPPLFIPPGFFEKKIKIRYGYKDNLAGCVNINPSAQFYSFQDPIFGADLKIGLENIPLFWKKRISKLEINPRANLVELEKAVEKRYNQLKKPFIQKSKLYYFLYRNKLKFYRFLYNLKLVRLPILYLMNKSPKLKHLYKSSYKK